MEIKKIDYDFSVCKVEDYSRVNLDAEYSFVGKTDEEKSLVCITEDIPPNVIERDDGWKAFRIQGVLDFSLIGILSENGHFVQFGKDSLPSEFSFDDAGDEWEFCCVSNTGRFKNIEEFIEIHDWNGQKELEIKEEILEAESESKGENIFRRANMDEFLKSVKEYYAQESDYDGVEEDEEAFNSGMIFPDDFVYFRNLEVVRLMSCELDVHSLKFLESLPKLRVLEVGEVSLYDMEGIDKLIGLEKLAIWAN